MTAESENAYQRRIARDIQRVLGDGSWEINVSDDMAYYIAGEIFQPDTKVTRRERVPREQWEQATYKPWHSKNVMISLITEALENGYIPMCKPTVELFFYEWKYPNHPIPVDVIEADMAQWDFVEVATTLLVRKSQ
jgi:hypothetical protein